MPTYDELGTLITFTDPAGASEHWRYDANGNVVRYVDREGSVWQSEYASWNLLVRSINPLGHVISYDYTRTEKPCRVVDPGGTVTDFAYDLKDRKVKVSRHGLVKDSYQYDLADNLIEHRDSIDQVLVNIEVGVCNLPQKITLGSGVTRNLDHDSRGRVVRSEEGDFDQRLEYSGPYLVCDEHGGRGVHYSAAEDGTRVATILSNFSIRWMDLQDGTIAVKDPTGKTHRIKMISDGIFLKELSNGTREVAQYDWEGRCEWH